MKVVAAKTEIKDFIQFVSSNKKSLNKWQFLHVSVQDSTNTVNVGEVEQFLKFHVSSPNAWMMIAEERRELLVFMDKDKGLTLTKFEKALQDDFPCSSLRVQFRGFEGDGLEKFSNIVVANIDPEDTIANVLFKRMSRSGNSILVLDDDPVILKQIEKILFGFGNVVTLETPENFLDVYKEYAPDILFLDIHLRTAMGNEILKELTTDIDPQAHVIMISSDTHKDMIVDIKDGGAKGFVVKPLERSKLYQKIVHAPTIITKAGV